MSRGRSLVLDNEEVVPNVAVLTMNRPVRRQACYGYGLKFQEDHRARRIIEEITATERLKLGMPPGKGTRIGLQHIHEKLTPEPTVDDGKV